MSNQLFSVVWIEHCSKYSYAPETFSDYLANNKAVHLGCMPGADPQRNSHVVLVPHENLAKLCAHMSELGQDAYHRVDSNGVAYLTDDAGKSWYTIIQCTGKSENSAYAGPLNIFNALCKVSCYLGFLQTVATPEVKVG